MIFRGHVGYVSEFYLNELYLTQSRDFNRRARDCNSVERVHSRKSKKVESSAPSTVCLHGTGGCASCRDSN